MTPHSFLNEVVRPNLADYEASYSDHRLAYNAVAAVDALAAHIFHAQQPSSPSAKDDSEFRERLAEESQSFRIIRDIAKAQKHVLLTRGPSTVKHASAVKIAEIGWGELDFGRGRFGGPAQVIVQLDDGRADYVEQLLTEAVQFLCAKLEAFNGG